MKKGLYAPDAISPTQTEFESRFLQLEAMLPTTVTTEISDLEKQVVHSKGALGDRFLPQDFRTELKRSTLRLLWVTLPGWTQLSLLRSCTARKDLEVHQEDCCLAARTGQWWTETQSGIWEVRGDVCPMGESMETQSIEGTWTEVGFRETEEPEEAKRKALWIVGF